MDFKSLTDFLLYQEDYIRCLHGMAAVSLMVVCLVMRQQQESKLPWTLLAFFGLLYGLHDGLQIGMPIIGGGLSLEILNSLLIIISGTMLFEFGRRGNLNLKKNFASRWIFVPLLALIAVGWLRMGHWHGLDEAANIFLFFPGGVLTALVMLSASRKYDKSWPRRWLSACSLLMIIYALQTVLSGWTSNQLISLLNNREFTQCLALLTSAAIGGGLLLGMASTLALFSQALARVEPEDNYFRKQSLYNHLFCGFLIAMIIVAGYFFVNFLDSKATAEQRYRADDALGIINSRWDSFMNNINREVWGIAGWSSAISAVAMGGENTQQVTEDLEYYRLAQGVDICYLLDARGKVVAPPYLTISAASSEKIFPIIPM